MTENGVRSYKKRGDLDPDAKVGLAARRKDADPREVTVAFCKCFREGDEAAQYSAILATGQRDDFGGEAEYFWRIWLPYDPKRPDSTQRWLTVYVTEDPGRITRINVANTMD